MNQNSDSLCTLSGRVEQITYHAPDSAFTVAQVRVEGHAQLITAAGDLMAPAPGTTLLMRGRWNEHPRYGRQFRVTEFETRLPVDADSVRQYLGSGLIKGIGPVMAERIVARFGAQTLAVMDEHIERLSEVDGIGKKRLDQIREAFRAQNDVRDLMLFLQGHGMGPAYVTRIYKQYGRGAVARLKENPYRLAEEIHGIGFLIADRIAGRIGFSADAPLRIAAGVLHVLSELTDEGHAFGPYDLLIEKALALLHCDQAAVERAMADLASTKRVVIEAIAPRKRDRLPSFKAVYPMRYFEAEAEIARRLKLLLQSPATRTDAQGAADLARIQRHLGIELAAQQTEAVGQALRRKVLVITGGPGTGKTTIIRAVTRLYERRNAEVLLAAPTGRAAKRLSQAAGRPAKTIHRLLEYNPILGRFQRHGDRPLLGDLVIIDEASMIDMLLMDHLLKAIPLSAGLILVGDVDQLPSVGPGQVLKDIIASAAIPAVALDHIFRQARGSGIVVNAHRINAGRMPLPGEEHAERLGDFYFIEQEAPEKIAETILTLVTRRIPARFGLDPIDDIQVLTPMHRGEVGAENLNRRLQALLNPQELFVGAGERRLFLKDKVMQIRNNYDKEVFNGDLGRIHAIDSERRTVTVRFDEREVTYEFGELDEIVPAYAVSVHKAQGSEYPAVVIPVAMQHYVLLQRNLIYTAVTRARRLTVLVGSKRALAVAINNRSARQRHTRLDFRLRA
jgi:exodeoxyribonuclease V alpha subunit